MREHLRPPWIQSNLGNEAAVTFCFVILFTSLIVFAFTFWWLMSGWWSFQPFCMAMLSFGSFLGLTISVSALVGIYGILPIDIYFWWRDWPATILTGIVMVLALINLTYFEKKKSTAGKP